MMPALISHLLHDITFSIHASNIFSIYTRTVKTICANYHALHIRQMQQDNISRLCAIGFHIGKRKVRLHDSLFLLLLLQPTTGHHSLATAATAEQPLKQQAIIFSRLVENDFKIGTSRDNMKYKANPSMPE